MDNTITRGRLEQVQHTEGIWCKLLPAFEIPHHEKVSEAKNGSLHLNIIHDEASTIIPEQEDQGKQQRKHLYMHIVLLATTC